VKKTAELRKHFNRVAPPRNLRLVRVTPELVLDRLDEGAQSSASAFTGEAPDDRS
jgi:hypothetical protein